MSDLCAICHERIPEGGDIRRGRSIQDSLATPHGLLARYKGLSASLGECGRPRPTDQVQKFMDWTRPQGVGKGREGGAFLPPPHRFDIRRINKHSERAGRKVAFEETLKEHNSDGIPLHELLHHCRPNPFKRSSMVDRNTWGNSNSLLGYR